MGDESLGAAAFPDLPHCHKGLGTPDAALHGDYWVLTNYIPAKHRPR